MSIKYNSLIEVKGFKAIESEKQYTITDDTLIELKGEFRSCGDVKSRIYFGLISLRENGEEILGKHVLRVDEPLIVKSVCSDRKSLILNKKPEKWDNSNEKYNTKNFKYIGIYYDGKTEHLPDYLIFTPAYNNYNDNIINLNKEIPEDVVKNIKNDITIVMNHHDTNTRDYSAANGVEVPEKWTEYKVEYRGYNKIGEYDQKGKFRPGTRLVRPFVYCNCDNKGELEIKNIEITIKENTIKEKPNFVGI